MITVKFMKPFYTKVSNRKLRLVFAYQYFSIVKDDKTYWFVPIEGKEIEFDLDSLKVENLSEVFVFQSGNQFIRLPLYQLLLISDVQDHLTSILEQVIGEIEAPSQLKNAAKQTSLDEELKKHITDFINQFELNNIDKLIDDALAKGDKDAFHELSKYKNEWLKKQ